MEERRATMSWLGGQFNESVEPRTVHEIKLKTISLSCHFLIYSIACHMTLCNIIILVVVCEFKTNVVEEYDIMLSIANLINIS